jgi:hypothetical protein
MRHLVFLALISFGCAADDKGDEKQPGDVSEFSDTVVEMRLFGETIMVEPKQPELQCNQFMFTAITNQQVKCKSVTVDNETDLANDGLKWAVKSPDGEVDISMFEKNGEQAFLGEDEDYYCWMFSGLKRWADRPEDEFDYTSLTVTAVTAQKSLESPEQLEPSKTFILGFPNTSDCIVDGP